MINHKTNPYSSIIQLSFEASLDPDSFVNQQTISVKLPPRLPVSLHVKDSREVSCKASHKTSREAIFLYINCTTSMKFTETATLLYININHTIIRSVVFLYINHQLYRAMGFFVHHPYNY